MEISVGVAVVAVLVLLRHLAVRRVIARQGRFVWIAFAPTLIGAIAVLLIGIRSLAAAPFVGVAMIVAGALYLAIVVRFLSRLSTSVSAAGPKADLGAVITEPATEYLTTMTGLILASGLLAAVGLIAWGVIQAMS